MRRLAVGIGLVVLLAGCGSDPKASSLPPVPTGPGAASPSGSPGSSAASAAPSASPTPTVTHSPAPPPPVPLPVAATRPDPAGAEAFARFWIDELNAAYALMNPVRLAAISGPGCQTCNNYVRSLTAGAEKGLRYTGAVVHVTEAVSSALDAGQASVVVNYDSPEAKIYASDGTVTYTQPPEPHGVLEVRAAWVGDRWVASEVVQVS